jgi:hypothetical protein
MVCRLWFFSVVLVNRLTLTAIQMPTTALAKPTRTAAQSAADPGADNIFSIM